MSERQKLVARSYDRVANAYSTNGGKRSYPFARKGRPKTPPLSTIADAVPYPFAIADRFGRIVLQNTHWDLVCAKRSLFSDIADDDETLMLTFGVKESSPTGWATAAKHIRELFTGQRHAFTLTHKHSDGGNVRWFRMDATGLRDLPDHIAIIHRDVGDIRQANIDIHRLSMELVQAQDNERRRIARLIHDTTAQELVASKLYLEKALENAVQSGRFYASGVKALDHLEQSLREIRTLSFLLHPPDLDEFNLDQAVRLFLKGFAERTGIQVAFDFRARIPPISPDFERILLLIIQEALSNVYRHSGSKAAVVTMRSTNGKLVLEIKDYGRGCPTYLIEGRRSTGPGVGIASIRARANECRGTFTIQSSEHGTTLRVVFPTIYLTQLAVAPLS